MMILHYLLTDEEKVVTITGSKKNLKITDKEDLNIFKSLKRGKTYSGIGFDIHRLVKGKKLYLGGIKIPFALGTTGSFRCRSSSSRSY